MNNPRFFPFNKFLLTSFYDLKKNYFIIIIINACLIIDIEIGRIPDFISEQIKSPFGIFTFILICCVTIFAQIYLQKFAEKDNKTLLSKSKYLLNLSKIAKYSSYILIANLVLVILMILFLSEYSLANLLLAQNINALIGSSILFLLGLKFIFWYFSNRNSAVIFFYALGFMILSVTIFFVYIGENAIIIQKPSWITPMMKVVYPDIEGNIFDQFYEYYKYLLAIPFNSALSWIYILLSQYTEKIQRKRLLLGLISSFILFMLTSVDSFQIIDVPDTNESLILYYMFEGLGTAFTGIIFGYSFWKVASKLEHNNPIRKYLIVTANGLIMFFTVTQSALIIAPYPPYALPSVSFIIVCTYLVNFGLYSSALSLSHNITLREKIREKTKNNSNLLGSIGSAQMTAELQRAVKDVKDVVDKEEKELEEKTGIETASLSEENVQDYMEQVMQEILKSKKKATSV